MREITRIEDMIYYNIQSELVFFNINSKIFKKFIKMTMKQRIQSLKDRGLLS